MQTLRLALKIFVRELRQGELSLLFLSLLIATGSLSCVGFLIQRIDASMVTHASQLNGAQLILKSSRAVPEHWLQRARKETLEQAQMQLFPSMLVRGNDFKLAQVKAVSSNFPLQGELLVRPTINGQSEKKKAPPAGEIWLDQRLLHFFKLSLNQHADNKNPLELGESTFKPGAILERVPGQSSSFFTIAPAALINLKDLAKTATVQPGSRVDYVYFFSGTEESLQRYKQWLEPQLQTGQRLRSGVEDLKAVNASLKKASDFLSLAAILTVLLAAIAITINSYRYGRKQYKNSAIMLCLGCSEKNILLIELYKLVTLGLLGCLSGVVLGYMVYAGLLSAIQDILPGTEALFYTLPAWVAFSCGLLLLLSVSMANLFQLKHLSPMALIRKEMASGTINTRLFYLLSVMGLVIISIIYTDNIRVTGIFYAIMILSVALLYFVAKILLQRIIKIGRQYDLLNRLALLNLERHRQGVLLQITTFSLIFSLLIIIFLVRTELLEKWQQQFPEQTPNHFVINVQNYETKTFSQYLQKEGIKTKGLYPMVRGRLTQLNKVSIKDAIPESAQQHNALHRELNLSFSEQVSQVQRQSAGISIERGLAKALNIKKGDQLGFQIGSQSIEGIVSEIRTVKWDSFQPNFYIIFSQGLIENYPMTWMASFYLSKRDKQKLNKLLEKFPGITVIEVDEILKEVQFIIEKVSHAIEIIFLFIMAAGALILSSSLSATLASRLYENAVIRTLGASSRQLRRSLLVELSVVAIVSAIIAILLSEASTFILYQNIFKIDYLPHPMIWLGVSLLAIIMICMLGLFVMNRIFTQSTHRSLNQFGH